MIPKQYSFRLQEKKRQWRERKIKEIEKLHMTKVAINHARAAEIAHCQVTKVSTFTLLTLWRYLLVISYLN